MELGLTIPSSAILVSKHCLTARSRIAASAGISTSSPCGCSFPCWQSTVTAGILSYAMI